MPFYTLFSTYLCGQIRFFVRNYVMPDKFPRLSIAGAAPFTASQGRRSHPKRGLPKAPPAQ